MNPKAQKKIEIQLNFIFNENLKNALKNYLENIIENCQTEEEKEYYRERKNNIHSEIIEKDEKKEIENYIAFKAGFNGMCGNYFSNWIKK